MSGARPSTLAEISAALEAASPSDVESGAVAFDEARRALRSLAGQLDRALDELDEAWQGASAAGARLAEPLRRTRELLHRLDEGEYGRQLRFAANALAAGQARVRDLNAQRLSGSDQIPYDAQAQQILNAVADGYRDVGTAIGGQSPPPSPPVEEPGIRRALIEAARDESAPMELAAADPAQLFRPVGPAGGLSLAGDPVIPPAGAAGGGGGMPMMPFMPPMGGGMGGMGGGMGGQAGDAAATRRAGLQGDQNAWGAGQNDGWNVIGRKERIDAAREEFRQDFQDKITKATKGDRDV